MHLRIRNVLLAAGLAVCVASQAQAASSVAPPETAISYQGVLSDNGTPFDGMRDFRFRLFDSAAGGISSATIQVFNVQVDSGNFTVEIDFGEAAWQGNQQYWLEIEVGPADQSQTYTVVGRQKLSASVFSLNTRGLTVNAGGEVGLGTATPVSPLHIVSGGDTGLEPWQNADLLIEADSGDVSLAMLGPDSQEKVIMFGNQHNKDDGAIIYDKFGQTKRGMSFRTAQTERMQITVDGNVGIGTITPQSRLDVRFDTGNGIEVTDIGKGGGSIGLHATVGPGTGVRGESTATSGSNSFGVYGQTASASGWGVYSNGRLGASGTKSFMIDHPLDPMGEYLLHYSSESPEPQNRYNGNAIMNAAGQAVVQLPDYFQSINKDFRYTLTPIGSPGPNLYIAQEVENNAFVIAGGTPGQKVTWEVIAQRNDAFVRQRGAPIEVQKVGPERGRLLMPELYGLSPAEGIHYVEPTRIQE